MYEVELLGMFGGILDVGLFRRCVEDSRVVFPDCIDSWAESILHLMNKIPFVFGAHWFDKIWRDISRGLNSPNEDIWAPWEKKLERIVED